MFLFIKENFILVMLLKLQFSLLSHSPRNFEAYEQGVVGNWRTTYGFQLKKSLAGMYCACSFVKQL